ncbi:MAG: hypothetical protein GY710_02105 [Desulfobacteraceae bacterium]|nr:hypothetical protein [Desulfobacteraceae bacterium]
MKTCRIEKRGDRMILKSDSGEVVTSVGIGSEDCNDTNSAQELFVDVAKNFGFDRVECFTFDGHINLG